MDRKIILLFAIWLLIVSPVWSENISNNQTLDSLIEIALGRNPALQAAEGRHRASEFKAEFAGWLPDPKLSIAALNLPRTSLSFDETPMSGLVVGLSQQIPWPGKLSTKADLAQLNSNILNMDLAARKNSIIRQVTHNYYEYSYWSMVETVLTESAQLIENIIGVAQTRYSNGYGSLQNVLRSETSKARIENKTVMAKQKASSALVHLAWLTDNSEIFSNQLLPSIPPIPTDDITIPADFSNPLLSKASLGAQVAKRKVDLAELDYWPNLTVGVDYRFRKNIPMDAISGEDFLTFKVGLNLPLWSFSRQKKVTQAARQIYIAKQADERTVFNNVKKQVTDIGLVLQSLRERADQYEKTIIPQAQATVAAARIAYEVGQIDFNAFLAAQLDEINIELEKLELLKQYHQQSAALRELTSDVQGAIQ